MLRSSPYLFANTDKQTSYYMTHQDGHVILHTITMSENENNTEAPLSLSISTPDISLKVE